jgi:hypothetical protein
MARQAQDEYDNSPDSDPADRPLPFQEFPIAAVLWFNFKGGVYHSVISKASLQRGCPYWNSTVAHMSRKTLGCIERNVCAYLK